MKTQNFSIFINVGGVSHSRIWEASTATEPMELGYKLPWKIERAEGEIRLMHDSGSVFPLPPEVLKDGTEIELKEPENDSGISVSLKVTELPGFEPLFTEPDAGPMAANAEWQVFCYSGDWILDAQPVRGTYKGHRAFDTAFTLTDKGGYFSLKIKDPTITLEGVDHAQLRSEGAGQYRVEHDQLVHLNLVTEVMRWRFVRVDKSAANKIVMMPQGPDAETVWFRRNLRHVATAFLLLILISFIMPKKEEEKKEEELTARIQLPKSFAKKKVEKDANEPPAAAGGGEQTEVIAENSQRAAPAASDHKTDKKVNIPKKDNMPAPKLATAAPAKTKQPNTPPQKVASTKPAKGAAAPGPVAPAKPKVSAAVLAAQKLQASMGDLAGAGGAALLAKSDRLAGGGGSRRGGGGAVFGGGGSTDGASGGALPSGGFSDGGQQNLKVAYTGGGGNGDGRGTASYGAGAPGGGMGVKGGKGNFVSVSLAQDDVGMAEEGLTKKEVWEVINKHLSEIRYCYERSIIRRPDIEGKLVVNFTIGKTGVVKTTAVKASTLEDQTLDQCVTTRLVTWRFPKPRGNIDVGVLYPFIFKRL